MTLISLGCYEAAKTRPSSLASKNTILSTLWIFEVDDGQNICFLRGSLVLLGSLSFSSLITDFYCVKNMPLGDASAIIFSAPLPTMVFSAVFLGSRLRMYKIFCGLLLYTGIMLVIRPPFIFKRWLLIWSFTLVLSINILYCRDVSVDNKNYYFGLIMGFAAVGSGAGTYICVGKLKMNSTSSSPILFAFHNAFFALVSNIICALAFQSSDFFSMHIFEISHELWMVYAILAFFGAIHIVCINVALKLINPILVSFTRSSDIVVAYLIQVLYFEQQTGMLGIFGSFCIISAIGILQFEESFIQKLPKYIQFVF